MEKKITYRNLAISIALAFIFTGTIVRAQGQEDPERRKDMIRSQKITFITDQLKLTPQEAAIFWPVYNEFDSRKENLLIMNKKGSAPEDLNIDLLTDKEVEQIADEEIELAQKMLDLRKEYHEQFKQILPIRKVLKLYQAEKEFQRVLLNRLRENAPKKGAFQR